MTTTVYSNLSSPVLKTHSSLHSVDPGLKYLRFQRSISFFGALSPRVPPLTVRVEAPSSTSSPVVGTVFRYAPGPRVFLSRLTPDHSGDGVPGYVRELTLETVSHNEPTPTPLRFDTTESGRPSSHVPLALPRPKSLRWGTYIRVPGGTVYVSFPSSSWPNRCSSLGRVSSKLPPSSLLSSLLSKR